MPWRDKYVKRFLHHVPRTVLLKAAIQAGVEVTEEVTKEELKHIWHDILKRG